MSESDKGLKEIDEYFDFLGGEGHYSIDLFEWEFKIWFQAFLSIHVCYRYHLMHSIHVEGKQILFSKQLKLTY